MLLRSDRNGSMLLQCLLRLFDRTFPPRTAAHLVAGQQGEEETYYYLRGQGYVMVARNWRSVRRRGEIDLIGWDGEVLCFIEVKTRAARTLVPAEVAVGHEKQRELRAMARDYLRKLRFHPPARFDIVSVYLARGAPPDITLFKNAFTMS